ncbi:bifunctional adenosylcobinamide kinase/adenosylcobinamide-phosphate guanylyltransferase [Desulfobacca acetoxidans]|nr:bifunctional adenosylcobinamide kinase/adenosylcobinamide-phosphate guanylyltransferase [Desulfobacterales bacterium]
MSIVPPFRVAFLSGGAKSGKSTLAQRWAEALPPPRLYVATGEALDEEMAARIADHQRARGPHWQTWEEPLALAAVLHEANGRYGVILVDCLTLWLSNLLTHDHQFGHPESAADQFCKTLEGLTTPIILVSNEVGWGIVPENSLARRFRDLAGRLNQQVAALADVAVLVVSGLPLYLKGRQIL